jgi:hypothetical protein
VPLSGPETLTASETRGVVECQQQRAASSHNPAPSRVAILDTGDRSSLVPRVLEAIRHLPPGPPGSLALLDHVTAWLRAHPRAGAFMIGER